MLISKDHLVEKLRLDGVYVRLLSPKLNGPFFARAELVDVPES